MRNKLEELESDFRSLIETTADDITDVGMSFEELKEEFNDWIIGKIGETDDNEEIPFEFLTDIAEEMMSRRLTEEEIVELTLIYG